MHLRLLTLEERIVMDAAVIDVAEAEAPEEAPPEPEADPADADDATESGEDATDADGSPDGEDGAGEPEPRTEAPLETILADDAAAGAEEANLPGIHVALVSDRVTAGNLPEGTVYVQYDADGDSLEAILGRIEGAVADAGGRLGELTIRSDGADALLGPLLDADGTGSGADLTMAWLGVSEMMDEAGTLHLETEGLEDDGATDALGEVVAGLTGLTVEAQPLDATAATKLLLISDEVDDGDDLARAAADDVAVLRFDPTTTDLDKLLGRIDAIMDGRPAESLALAVHDQGAGRFHLTGDHSVTLTNLARSQELRDFFVSLGERVEEDGRLDLLSCRLAGNEEGDFLRATIEGLSSRTVAASTDATGTPGHGGDWFLEAGGVDAGATYFDAEDLEDFGALLTSEQRLDAGLIGTDPNAPPPGDSFGGFSHRFGAAIASSGDTFVVGATGDPLEDPFGGISPYGAAFVYEWSGQNFGLQAILTASDPSWSAAFGTSVAIDGDTIVVGASGAEVAGIDTGAAYVFTRSGNYWMEEAKLTASDGEALDFFGASVAIEGDTIAVGATGWDDDLEATLEDGAVYIYEIGLDGMWDDGSLDEVALLKIDDAFEEQANNTMAGASLSLRNDVLLVGASQNVGGGTGTGEAFIFEKSGDGDAWTWDSADLTATLQASDRGANDLFGATVLLSDDGATAFIGAAGWDDGAGSNEGAVYVFEEGVGWASINEDALLTHTASSDDQAFGSSLALTDSGALVVGAPGDQVGGVPTGKVFVFTEGGNLMWDNGDVDLMSTLTATDGEDTQELGFAVAAVGEIVVAGAPHANPAGVNSGSVFAFNADEIPWGADMNEDFRYLTPRHYIDAQQGYSVDVSGDYAVVGAPGMDGENNLGAGAAQIGAAFVYKVDAGDWLLEAVLENTDAAAAAADNFGASVAIFDDTLGAGNVYVLVGTPGRAGDSGGAYLFERDQGGLDNWGQYKSFVGQRAGDRYGFSLAMDQDIIAIGTENGNEVFVYHEADGGGDWGDGDDNDVIVGGVEASALLQSGLPFDDDFGVSLATDGALLVVGAPGDDQAAMNQGRVYVYDRDLGGLDNWGLLSELSEGGAESDFGTAVDTAAGWVVVGAPDAGAFAEGEVYLYDAAFGLALEEVFSAPDPWSVDFGLAVATDGEFIAVGDPNDTFWGPAAGAVHVYEWDWLDTDAWFWRDSFSAFDTGWDDGFGAAVALDDGYLLAGAPYQKIIAGDGLAMGGVGGNGFGASYMFDLLYGGFPDLGGGGGGGDGADPNDPFGDDPFEDDPFFDDEDDSFDDEEDPFDEGDDPFDPDLDDPFFDPDDPFFDPEDPLFDLEDPLFDPDDPFAPPEEGEPGDIPDAGDDPEADPEQDAEADPEVDPDPEDEGDPGDEDPFDDVGEDDWDPEDDPADDDQDDVLDDPTDLTDDNPDEIDDVLDEIGDLDDVLDNDDETFSEVLDAAVDMTVTYKQSVAALNRFQNDPYLGRGDLEELQPLLVQVESAQAALLGESRGLRQVLDRMGIKPGTRLDKIYKDMITASLRSMHSANGDLATAVRSLQMVRHRIRLYHYQHGQLPDQEELSQIVAEAKREAVAAVMAKADAGPGQRQDKMARDILVAPMRVMHDNPTIMMATPME